MIKHSMKKLFLLCICSLGLYGSLFPQAPTESPIVSPTAATAVTTATAATAATSIAASASTPTAAPGATSSSVSSDLADRIHRKLEKKLGHKHGIIIDGDDKDEDPDLQQMRNLVAIPIVAIVFLSIFGAPVAIVVMIGIFSIIATRMRQRTIRMMV